ncbi:hypothetical protein PVNG_05790 [Plasmodium vivax North Korean]|uniref:Uncharacterized protein n=1 Tax=Plasmodium vivax North Korean TaxID=1035514 RepID=A0A0J9U0R6_PLAVI|nr:hypothetical protein PVNG_05790 [Plasmodium vivax North Korean]
MGESKSYDTYLNYHDYDKYNFYFNAPWINFFDEAGYQESLNLLEVDKNIKDTHSEAFKLLFKYINNGSVFYEMDIPKACKYISYALRNNVEKEKYQVYDDKTFNIFKIFLIKSKQVKSITDQRCEDLMVLIDSDIFEKMHNLYTLFKKYAVFAPTPHNYRQSNITCQGLREFVILYNDFIKDQKLINKSLYYILKNFEQSVTKTITDNKNICANQTLTISPLNAYYLPEEVKSNINAPERQHPNQLPPAEARATILEQAGVPGTSSRISHVSTVFHTPQEINEDGESVRLGESETEQESKKSLESEEVELGADVARTEEEAQDIKEVYRAGKYPPIRRLSGHYGDVPMQEILTQRRFMDNLLVTQKSEPPKEDEGFMANMRNTIIGVLGEVDPVPVVGVSEEEEDVYIESRVVSMDNS